MKKLVILLSWTFCSWLPLMAQDYREAIRKDPSNLRLALEVAASYRKESAPIDWLMVDFHPAHASDAFRVGMAIDTKAPDVSCALFNRALEMSFDATDRSFMEQRSGQSFVFNPQPEKDFRTLVQLRMLVPLYEAKRLDEARQILNTLATETPDALLGLPARFIGMIQAGSGAPIITNPIKHNIGGANQDAAEYWLAYGENLHGQKEWDRAQAAFLRGLELVPPPTSEAEDNSAGKGVTPAQTRYRLILAMVQCLHARGESQKARDFLLQEIPRWPVNGSSVDLLVCEVTTGTIGSPSPQGCISPDEPVIWEYISKRNVWSSGVEHALVEMAARTPPENREAFWRRATTLAIDNSSRSAILEKAKSYPQ